MKPRKAVVFDLNQTFYTKSSKDEFYKFICSKRPGRIVYYLQMVFYVILKKLKALNQTEFKENFFNYLDGMSPEQVRAYAVEFWKGEYPDLFHKQLRDRFEEWKKQGVDLICATGGLELYVQPLFELFPVTACVGTKSEYVEGTYQVIGKACKNEEKIRRIGEFYKGQPYRIIEAYSDSKEEILKQAEKAFLLKEGNILTFVSG